MLNAYQISMPVNFFDCVVECAEYVQSVEHSEHVGKKDVIDGIRHRMSIMISKILTNNHYTSGTFIGWDIQTNA